MDGRGTRTGPTRRHQIMSGTDRARMPNGGYGIFQPKPTFLNGVADGAGAPAPAIGALGAGTALAADFPADRTVLAPEMLLPDAPEATDEDEAPSADGDATAVKACMFRFAVPNVNVNTDPEVGTL